MRSLVLSSLLTLGLNAFANETSDCLYGHIQSLNEIEKLSTEVEASFDYDKNKATYELFDAIKKCNRKKIEKAIKKGANLNALNSAYNNQVDRYTPLISAIRRDCQLGVDLLIAAGADVNLDHTITGNPPLMIAARWGRTEAVKSLIKANADVNQMSSVGRTAIIVAAFDNNKEIVELLLTRKDLNLERTSLFDNSATALGVAARQNHLEVLKLLVNHSPEIKPISLNQVEGALSKANYNKHTEAEKLLLAYKAKYYP
jgi:ankyrin repeat protein